MIASALAFIFLSIVARKPLDDDEVVLEAGGVRRHPWRAWIILAAGFLALQAAVALADYLDSMLWEMLEILVGVGRWSTREPVVHDSLGDFNMAGLHYAVKNIVFTVLPFLLFALAVVLRMRPWCGWILGAFLAIALGLEMWGFESGSWYALASRALLFGECCAVPGVLLLWLYHAKVSKLRAVIDDDFV